MNTTLFLVHNGQDYSDYQVLALFTKRELADTYADAADGVVEEWPADVPPEAWLMGSAYLTARKEKGRWVVNMEAQTHDPATGPLKVECRLGHYSGWDKPDPKTGKYTSAYSVVHARTQADAEKAALEAFWQKVAELDPESARTTS